jgi:hypothetical protein
MTSLIPHHRTAALVDDYPKITNLVKDGRPPSAVRSSSPAQSALNFVTIVGSKGDGTHPSFELKGLRSCLDL